MIALDQVVPRLFVDVPDAFEMWIKAASIIRELTRIRSRSNCNFVRRMLVQVVPGFALATKVRSDGPHRSGVMAWSMSATGRVSSTRVFIGSGSPADSS